MIACSHSGFIMGRWHPLISPYSRARVVQCYVAAYWIFQVALLGGQLALVSLMMDETL